MSQAKIKRFYKTVAVQAEADPSGYGVRLDGRPVRTPAKGLLRLPGRGVAEAVAAEWRAQGAEVEPSSMPLTTLACTAIDLIGARRAQVVQEMAAYAGHDLLCYRAEAPADLAARQQAAWQPLLDWAALALDAPLAVTAGIVAVPQPPAALASLRRAVEALGDFELAALSCAANAAGSLIVGLALHAGRLGAQDALEVALLDELYQAERWGDDPEAARRRAAIAAELSAAARAFALLRG